jgi:glyoxalase family protein
MAPPRIGHGLAVEVGLEVASGSLEYWGTRLEQYGVPLQALETRFNDRVLPLLDPHGMKVALVEPAQAPARAFTPWDGGPVPPERQVRGLYGAQVWERDAAATAAFLERVLGFERLASENGWTRYGFRHAAGVIDLREAPDARRGAWGVGAVHHLAWRVDDERHQAAVRDRVEDAGASATPVIDRFWFKSVYFKEPGGVLFELATDGPGFSVDEDPAHLGEALVLPPFLEAYRGEIEKVLPKIDLPASAERSRIVPARD